MDDEGHDANIEDGFDLDGDIADAMDGWDDPIIADPIFQDEAQDDESEISFEDYIPNYPWLEGVNSSASDIQHDD